MLTGRREGRLAVEPAGHGRALRARTGTARTRSCWSAARSERASSPRSARCAGKARPWSTTSSTTTSSCSSQVWGVGDEEGAYPKLERMQRLHRRALDGRAGAGAQRDLHDRRAGAARFAAGRGDRQLARSSTTATAATGSSSTTRPCAAAHVRPIGFHARRQARVSCSRTRRRVPTRVRVRSRDRREDAGGARRQSSTRGASCTTDAASRPSPCVYMRRRAVA